VFSQTPTLENTATGVYDGIWMDDTYNTVSSIVFLGNLAVCYAHAGNYQTSSNPTYYWQAYHVLGDGSIMPYRVNPTANTVSHASTIPAGSGNFMVNAQAGSYVAISQNNVLKGVALVPANGSSVNVAYSGITSGSQVRIVVTKPQRQPYIQDINVGGAPQSFTINVSASPTNGGTVTGGGTYQQGQSCTVSATANSGYTFTNWTENGNVVSTNANYTFTVTANRNLIANFSNQVQSYTVSVSANPTNGGTVAGGGTYQQGQSCTVTATANTGYTFSNWTENGNVVSANASYSFTVTGNRTLVANFTAQPVNYTISVSANPTNGGTVAGGGTYQQGQSCTVTATSANGYIFVRWTENGNSVSTNASYTFTVAGSRTLVAQFQQQSYTINASANPTNGGSVSGGGAFHYGESCTLIATPAAGYTFSNWTENGNVVSSNATYSFTVTANRTLVAHFQPQSFTISVSANPTAGGNATGGGTFNYGQSCTVSATPAADYMFSRWTENGNQVSTNPNYTFTVTGNRNLVANFTYSPQSYTVSVLVNPIEGGTVTGGGNYNHGQNCTIVATANEGYSFINWTENGVQISTNPSYSFNVTGDHSFVANFEAQSFQIKASVDPAEAGVAVGEGSYQYGEEAILSVIRNEDYEFLNWTENGVVVSEEETYSFVVTGSRELVAHYLHVDGVGETNVNIEIYPNPVSDKLTIEADEALQSVEVYNMMGALVISLKDQADKVELSVGDLTIGTYFVRMATQSGVATRKFVKK